MRFFWRIKKLQDKHKVWRADRRLRNALKAVQNFPRISNPKPHGLDGKLVVTLTSYPPRFPTLAATLKSLLDQKICADHTVLWLAEKDLPQLPKEVLSLKNHGLEIRVCNDIRSYKKLIPALSAYSGSWFATADDDVYYPPSWLRNLVVKAQQNKKPVVVASRAHLARVDEKGIFLPYKLWEENTKCKKVSLNRGRIFPTGVGGVLYSPGSLPECVHDEDRFMNLCPDGDDIWFFWMSRMAGANHVTTKKNFDIIPWPTSQNCALFHTNVVNKKNDLQIVNMQKEFGPVP